MKSFPLLDLLLPFLSPFTLFLIQLSKTVYVLLVHAFILIFLYPTAMLQLLPHLIKKIEAICCCLFSFAYVYVCVPHNWWYRRGGQ